MRIPRWISPTVSAASQANTNREVAAQHGAGCLPLIHFQCLSYVFRLLCLVVQPRYAQSCLFCSAVPGLCSLRDDSLALLCACGWLAFRFPCKPARARCYSLLPSLSIRLASIVLSNACCLRREPFCSTPNAFPLLVRRRAQLQHTMK